MKRIAPSFLSADITRCAEQLTLLEQAGCSCLHLDIMDGHFVPNISFGPAWVKQLRAACGMTFDVHLMVEEPGFLLPAFAEAGAEICTVHAEAVRHLDRTLHQIRDFGMRPGVALNPASPLALVEEVLDLADLVLIMSVNPGFGGQKFIPNALRRLQRVAELRTAGGYDFLIEVDGGVTAGNAAQVAAAGADWLVAGSAVLGAAAPAVAYATLAAAIGEEKA